MDEVFTPIKAGILKVPSADSVHSLESRAFSVLVEFDEFETDDLALERPDEALILDLYVLDHNITQTPRILAMASLSQKIPIDRKFVRFLTECDKNS